jgi:RND family efflux transporter MFP subunit
MPSVFRFCVLTLFTLGAGPISFAQPPASLVVVAPIVEQQVASGQTSVGTVMPLKRAIIGSAVDGRVIEFAVEEGDRVEAGQKLAQLLTDTISLELAAAEAELELRRQQLAELENGTRAEELAQLLAKMNAAAARHQYLDARRKRIESVFKGGRATSEEERDEAVAAALEAEQLVMEAKAAREMAVVGPRQEAILQAKAQVAVQQAVVDRLKDQIEKHTIISRFPGYVVAENTELGQWVKQGEPVVEVAALDEVEISAQVVEQHVPFVKVGAPVTVEIPALANRLFEGTVTAIVPQANVQARTFPVKVRVKNEITSDGPLLKSGMYARVTLPAGAERMALVVPKDALVLGKGPTPLVYVVEPGPDGKTGKATAVPVQIGVAAGAGIQITGPFKAGQLVAVEGNERIFGPNVAISGIRKAAAPPAADSVSRSR